MNIFKRKSTEEAPHIVASREHLEKLKKSKDDYLGLFYGVRKEKKKCK